jgi:uncharacterized protein (TIGR03032 family)
MKRTDERRGLSPPETRVDCAFPGGRNPSARLAALWAHHHAQMRDPAQIVSQWSAASNVDPALLAHRVTGAWWDILREHRLTLLVTREYEHLVLAFGVRDGKPRLSHLPLPHPSGIAVDRKRGRVHIASTRNPNVLFEFAPSTGQVIGRDIDERLVGTLAPVRARYLPGPLYLHDLAMIDGRLHGNAVGLNAVVRFDEAGSYEPVWWPRSIDGPEGPRFERNYLQLNSIAAGPTLKSSFFTASTTLPSRRRPGHLNFAVDGRGVLFSGKTRDVCGTGLTRPHSARIHDGEVWIDNSGYGELGRIVDGRFESHMRLPGWTRGLCFHERFAFVGTSRVLPRYARYAPGLDAEKCVAGIHIVDMTTARVVGSITWPLGNQLFAIEVVPDAFCVGFPEARQRAA